MENESWPRRLYNFFQNHWIASALIATLPGWFSIAVRLKGQSFGFTTKEGVLTALGDVLFWGIPGSTFLFTLAKFGADKYDSNAKIDGHILYQKVMDGVNSVTRAKLQRFEGFIRESAGSKLSISPFERITQPQQQLDKILENLQITLSQVTDINRDAIGLSIIAKADEDTEWSWISKVNIENDLDLKTLISNPCSSARQVIDRKTSSLFHGDKAVAEQKREYVYGPRDDSYATPGSIVVRDVSIRSETHLFLHAILSISTNGKQLCEEGNRNTQKKICEFILPAFESRLRLELSLYYIKHRMWPASAAA
jgi:hypothetical protein